MLDAGIDVFSTVNVQHLESLNDRVAELTGVRVRETFPDQVLGSADEVVLVDLTPEALIARLRAGKVYPAERVPAALNNFFRVENLVRAARGGAAPDGRGGGVEARRSQPPSCSARARSCSPTRPRRPSAERVLALVTPRPRSQRLVRRAWRSAQRLGAELDLLYVMRPGSPPRGEEREQLEALRGLASVLGAHLMVEEGDDLVDTAAGVAAERGTTYVLIGQPQPHTGLRRFSESLPDRLVRKLPGRGRADRGRPVAPARPDYTRRRRRNGEAQAAPPRPRARGRLGPADPVPVHRFDGVAGHPRRDAAAGALAGRNARARLPGRGAASPVAGVAGAGARRARRRCRCSS